MSRDNHQGWLLLEYRSIKICSKCELRHLGSLSGVSRQHFSDISFGRIHCFSIWSALYKHDVCYQKHARHHILISIFSGWFAGIQSIKCNLWEYRSFKICSKCELHHLGSISSGSNRNHLYIMEWVCSLFFRGLNTECVIRTQNKFIYIYIYIYIYHFWKISGDNHQWWFGEIYKYKYIYIYMHQNLF